MNLDLATILERLPVMGANNVLADLRSVYAEFSGGISGANVTGPNVKSFLLSRPAAQQGEVKQSLLRRPAIKAKIDQMAASPAPRASASAQTLARQYPGEAPAYFTQEEGKGYCVNIETSAGVFQRVCDSQDLGRFKEGGDRKTPLYSETFKAAVGGIKQLEDRISKLQAELNTCNIARAELQTIINRGA